MADYLAQTVAVRAGIAEGDVFEVGGVTGVDATCATRLATPDGSTMWPFIGASDVPALLFTTDRMKFAPTFYACSFSLTKFLVERVGLSPLIALFSMIPDGPVEEGLTRLTKAPMSAVREEWRSKIGREGPK